jgi:hypothetical protein
MQYETGITKLATVRPHDTQIHEPVLLVPITSGTFYQRKFLENENCHRNDQENENFSVLPCNQRAGLCAAWVFDAVSDPVMM